MIETKKIFEKILDNAIDFIEKSFSELKEHPKSSVIHFYSAIELFFKARLLKEHWSLIVKKPENAKATDFLDGNFQSVGIKDAITRLKNIVGETFTQDEIKCFNELRNHRNKLIHFFNSKYISPPDDETIYDIIAEQCKGWFFLHRLLCSKWDNYFSKYREHIEKLDKLMLSKREYLQAKFETLKSDIYNKKKSGILFYKCPACGYESLEESEIVVPLIYHKCLVCNYSTRMLKVSCPQCKTPVLIDDYAEGVCQECGDKIDLEYLLDEYGPNRSNKDYLIDPKMGFCHFCERPEESVIYLGDELICLSCLEIHSSMNQCQWCGSWCTGDLSDSFYTGCFMCEGRYNKD